MQVDTLVADYSYTIKKYHKKLKKVYVFFTNDSLCPYFLGLHNLYFKQCSSASFSFFFSHFPFIPFFRGINEAIANGSQFARTGRSRTRARPNRFHQRRKTVEGQLSCEGPSGIPWRAEECTRRRRTRRRARATRRRRRRRKKGRG